MDKPCILVIGPTSEQGGGVATFINILMSSATLQQNFQMVILDTSRSNKEAGLENQFRLMNVYNFVSQVFKLLGIIFRLQPRLMHLQITSGLAFWKTAVFILLGKIFVIKTVAHLHGGMFDNYYQTSKPIVQKLIAWVFRNTDVVIALSENWRQFLLEDVSPDLHVEIVSNTIDMMFAQALEQRSAGTSRTEKIILFLGSLGYRKGIFDVLKAIPLVTTKHPDAVFQFAGEEETRGEKLQVDQICRENDLAGNIQFLGMVSGGAKLELFQRAMVYILPSYGENLPYALLEAMSMGLPVVTTPVGAIPEIIIDGQNGFLIRPGDFETLASRIVEILDKPELRKKMSQANIESIKNRFLPDAVMVKMCELYTRVIDKK